MPGAGGVFAWVAWRFEHLTQLAQAGVPLVLVTVAAVQGYAPREAGAKMLVTDEATYGSVGREPRGHRGGPGPADAG